ncbi:MAG: hypothetical protein WC792_01125 [Candidatus Micrarchaeia archaeon]|jgi:tRNA (guanine26-N2/guanine27-N2)-dimethyltransferase
MAKTKTAVVQEGEALLEIPAQSITNPFHAEAFYNPFMRLNRSISVLVLQTALPHLRGANVLDGLSSLGARGVRYGLEAKGVTKIAMVDANPGATKLARKNVRKNAKKLPKKVEIEVIQDDLNRALLASKDKFAFIELDPFGSPVFYLENSVRRSSNSAMLSVTTTDLANLYGSRAPPCIRMYDAKPLKCQFGHELALRILIGRIARTAAMQDFAATPMLSFYHRHYAKTFVKLERGAFAADESLKQNIGFVSLCQKCLHAESSKLPKGVCTKCGNKMDYAGPLWVGKTVDLDFLANCGKENEKRNLEDKAEISKLFGLLKGETEGNYGPWFWDLHEVARHHKIALKAKVSDAIASLEKKGFKAAKTHFSTVGIKTNADAKSVAEVLK